MNQDDQTPLLEIRDLTVSLESVRVLDGVSLDLHPGHLHAVIGPNGGGKTTMIRALLGEIPFRGSIRFHWRGSGRIGYVPQSVAIDATMPITVGDFLTLAFQRRPAWSGASRATRRDMHAALDQLGISDRLRRPMGALSGGELQRVLLAQALVPTPELLLLDEPSRGIDRRALEFAERALRQLREQGKTILIVTHDLEQVGRLADRVTCLNRKTRFDGPPSEVLTLEAALGAFSHAENEGV